MHEFTSENGNAETLLTEAFAWLKDLHHRDNGENGDALRSTERIITLLGSTTRELLQVFEQNIRLEAIVGREELPSQEAITAMVRERALKIIYHHYEYSGQNPIKSLKYGGFLTEQYLEECVRDGGGEKALHSFGLVMLDVDGLKAVKECIGHKGTNLFLKKLTKVLTDPESPTNVWMRETEGLEITPIVAGGDEFVLVINSAEPIDAALMKEIIDRYERDVTSSAELQAMIDFDDPVILLNYAGKSRAERQAIRLLPEDEQQAIFAEIRQHLPEKFIPSVTGGGATLAEGVILAAEHNDTRPFMETSNRFTEAAQEIFDEMFARAEINQALNKGDFKKRVLKQDPLHGQFLIRTKEAERLAVELQKQQELVAQLQEELRNQQEVHTQLRLHIQEQNALIARLMPQQSADEAEF